MALSRDNKSLLDEIEARLHQARNIIDQAPVPFAQKIQRALKREQEEIEKKLAPRKKELAKINDDLKKTWDAFVTLHPAADQELESYKQAIEDLSKRENKLKEERKKIEKIIAYLTPRTAKNFELFLKIGAFIKSEVEKNKDSKYTEETPHYLYSSAKQKMSIEDYLTHLAMCVSLCDSTLIIMLHYMMSFSLSPNVPENTPTPKKLNSFNVHRMMLASALAAHKYHFDGLFQDTYLFTQASDLSTEELDHIEIQFLIEKEFALYVSPTTYNLYAKEFGLPEIKEEAITTNTPQTLFFDCSQSVNTIAANTRRATPTAKTQPPRRSKSAH